MGVPEVEKLRQRADPLGQHFARTEAQPGMAFEDAAEHHRGEEVLHRQVQCRQRPRVHLELFAGLPSDERGRVAPRGGHQEVGVGAEVRHHRHVGRREHAPHAVEVGVRR